MADSGVTYSNIDEEFPKAGQDNDSQGFRDNFSEIKGALAQANVELGDLLTNGARVDRANDFNGVTLSNYAGLQSSKVVYNTGNFSSTKTIQWTDGEVQNLTVASGNATVILDSWPANNRYGKIRLIIRSDGSTRTVDFTAASGGSIRANEALTNALTSGVLEVSSATTPHVIDAWSTDGGLTVFLEYIGTFPVLP